jgi:sarcosine oxidase
VHSGGDETTMDGVDRSTNSSESPSLLVRSRLKIKQMKPVQSAVCLYTMTKDSHFAVGPHPGLQGLVVMSPCSGHGFKFASVMGEIAADYICDRKTAHPTEFLRLERLL